MEMLMSCMVEHMTADQRARFAACPVEHDLGATCARCGLSTPTPSELDSRMAKLTGLPRAFGA